MSFLHASRADQLAKHESSATTSLHTLAALDDDAELRAFDGLRSRSDGPQMMADSRSRRLNKQAYNRRNMSIDERVAFDQLMAKREADAKVRNAVLALTPAGAFRWSREGCA